MRKGWMLLGAAAITCAAIAAEAPQYGAWGLDTAGMDKATKPGDDFFRYANGTWLDATPIPGDKPGVSLRLAMTDRTAHQVHRSKPPAKTIPNKIHNFFESS